MRIKFVVFYTEGTPNDEGSDLTKVVRTVRSLVEEAGHEFDAYTPKRLYQILPNTQPCALLYKA